MRLDGDERPSDKKRDGPLLRVHGFLSTRRTRCKRDNNARRRYWSLSKRCRSPPKFRGICTLKTKSASVRARRERRQKQKKDNRERSLVSRNINASQIKAVRASARNCGIKLSNFLSIYHAVGCKIATVITAARDKFLRPLEGTRDNNMLSRTKQI